MLGWGKEVISGKSILLSSAPLGGCWGAAMRGWDMPSTESPHPIPATLHSGGGEWEPLVLVPEYWLAGGPGRGLPIGNLQLPVFKVKLP